MAISLAVGLTLARVPLCCSTMLFHSATNTSGCRDSESREAGLGLKTDFSHCDPHWVRVRVGARIRVGVRIRTGARISVGVRVGVGVRIGVRVRTICERRSGDQTRVDGVCDFERVPPDQLFFENNRSIGS